MVLSYFWLDLLVSCGFERGGSIKFRSLQEPLPTIASKHRYHPPRQGHHSCLGWWYWASAAAHCRSAHALGGEPPWKNPTMGNVFHQKKTFVYLLKKGVLCQNLGPQQYWTMYVFNCCEQSFSWLNMTIVQDVLQAFVRLRTLRVWRSSAASSCRMLGNQALEVLLMAQESDLLTACLPNTANIQAWNVFFSGFAVVLNHGTPESHCE